MCLNSSRKLLYVRRPRSFKDGRATGGRGGGLPHGWQRYVTTMHYTLIIMFNDNGTGPK
jgi:hypothetical protein